MSKPKAYWNYRMVAEYNWNENEVLRGWSFTIRDVYYADGKPTSWGAEPQYAVGETGIEVCNDLDHMMKAVYQPLLIVQGDTLVEHHQKCAALVKPYQLKEFETAPTKE